MIKATRGEVEEAVAVAVAVAVVSAADKKNNNKSCFAYF
jgi:hypothetical protein